MQIHSKCICTCTPHHTTQSTSAVQASSHAPPDTAASHDAVPIPQPMQPSTLTWSPPSTHNKLQHNRWHGTTAESSIQWQSLSSVPPATSFVTSHITLIPSTPAAHTTTDQLQHDAPWLNATPTVTCRSCSALHKARHAVIAHTATATTCNT